jgi:acyl-CoA synthetase (AMP-forming)/AMP-acid ligase II
MIFKSPCPPLDYRKQSVAQLLLATLDAGPGTVALIDAATDRHVTAGEVADSARRIATALAARGFAKGEVFAIVAPNIPEYGALLLGVWLAGGTATTINPMATADELASQFAETKTRFAFTVPPLLEKVIDGGRRAGVEEFFSLGGGAGASPFQALVEKPAIPMAMPIDPMTDLAALPWSSGTSGKPKAVMLTHDNLVAQLHQFLSVQEGLEGSIVGVLPFFHIYGLVLILMAALWRGAPLIVMGRFEIEAFLAALAKYRVEMAPIVPPIVVALAKHPSVTKYDLSSLKWIMSGAAPLGADIENACAERLHCRVIQGYGMTEVSGASHLHSLEPEQGRHGSVGFLAPSMEARVVDPETGGDLGIGARGELWLRGPNVTQGYLNRPEATAATIDADHWLHTGDICYVDDEGFWHIVDRLKELIKYKAHQVAPADLEAVLLSHPNIADAAVIPSPDPEAGEVPKAFVVVRTPMTAELVMDFVAGKVSPLDKVRRVEFVDSIPKSPSGKILRRLLVEKERAAMAARG